MLLVFPVSFTIDSSSRTRIRAGSLQPGHLRHAPRTPLGGSRCPRLLGEFPDSGDTCRKHCEPRRAPPSPHSSDPRTQWPEQKTTDRAPRDWYPSHTHSRLFHVAESPSGRPFPGGKQRGDPGLDQPRPKIGIVGGREGLYLEEK